MTSLYRNGMGLLGRLCVLGSLLLAATLVAGCGGGSSGSSGSIPAPAASFPGSPPAGGLNGSLINCLKKHGVRMPGRQPSPGQGQGFPAGGIPGSIQKALKACGVTPPGGVG